MIFESGKNAFGSKLWKGPKGARAAALTACKEYENNPCRLVKRLAGGVIAGLSLSLVVTAAVFAERMDPSLLPPDVTLTTGGSSASAPGVATPGAAAPGVATPGTPGATAPGAPAAAAPAAAAPPTAPGARPMGQMLPPGAVPTAPPPPTGAGTIGRPAANAPSNYSMFQTQTGNGPQAAPDVSHDPIAIIETPKGTITFRLFKSLAPKTVDNFIELAQKGFYNGLTFHRVEPNFCIQGGDPLGNGSGMYIDTTTHQPRFLSLEIAPALKHNAPGVVAMARSTSPNSASSQFYITLSPQPSLDGKYAIFGGVISGMNVVQSIAKGDKMTSVSVQMPQ